MSPPGVSLRVVRTGGPSLGWNAWRALRERPHIKLALIELPEATGGAVYGRRGERAAIIIDPRLNRQRRHTALAHELVHDERGGGCARNGMPDPWDAIAARDERAVDLEVARRLVPPADLEEFIQGMADIDLGVGPGEVSEQFDVCLDVAETALIALKEGHRRYVA